jgi:hypothetical protein
MTPRSEKDYRASNITTFILSVPWMTSTGDITGRGRPSFLPLARIGLRDSTQLLHLWQRKAIEYTYGWYSASGAKDDMQSIHQGWLDSGLTCRKRWLHPIPKAAITDSNSNISSPRRATSNIPQSPLWQFNLKIQTDQNPTSKPFQSRFP